MTLPDLDYSQSGEQTAILRAAEGIELHRFLDIGAGDGVTFSNTRALALAGWGGVLVEPAPWAFDRLAQLYADEENIDVIQAVVTGDDRGIVPFHYTPGDHLSTVELGEVAKWRDVKFHRMGAAAVTLADVLTWAGPVSVVSIDVEGRTSELVEWYQRFEAHWDYVECLIFERDPHRSVKQLITVGAWTIEAETPNNYVLRRV